MVEDNDRRRLQSVSTKSERKMVIKWMLAEVEGTGSEKKIAARANDRFPKVLYSVLERQIGNKQIDGGI